MSPRVFGQAKSQDASADTARVYEIPEITVTASRLPLSPSLSAVPITQIPRRSIEMSNASTLSGVLSAAPGLFVKDYGGNGALQTLAQRGLGPEHTSVLINGMRVGNPQNNLVDLALISPDEIETVEVFHGGNSASFGADAVAGVINILTKQTPADNSLRVSADVGSFGYRAVKISRGLSLSNVHLNIAYREEESKNDFPFTFQNGLESTSLIRRNADVELKSGTLNARVNFDSVTSLSFFGRALSSERGAPGAVAGPASMSVARQDEQDQLAQLRFSSRPSDAIQLHVGAQFHRATYEYSDSLFIVGSSWLKNESSIREMRLEPSANIDIGASTRAALGIEYSMAKGDGNSLSGKIDRSTQGFYCTVEQKIPLVDAIPEVILYPSIRFDRIVTSKVPLTNWSPQIGLVLPLGERAGIASTLRANAGRNFAAPTFNMLYYAGEGGVGNPNLKPEESTNYDIGASLGFDILGKHALTFSYYEIRMDNRIQWLSAGNASVMPKNIRSVRSKGIEISHRWAIIPGLIELNFNYTSSSTRKIAEDFAGDPNVGTQLIYVPGEMANASLLLSEEFQNRVFERIGASINISYSGFVYTTEDNSRFLPSHTVMNAGIFARLGFDSCRIPLRFEVHNLFNTSYQVISLYPMPGRSLRATMEIELSN